MSPTLLSCRLPCCCITRPVVGSPTLLLFGSSGCQLTHHPSLVLCPCCGVPPGCRCAVIVLGSSFHHCGHPGCTFVTILVHCCYHYYIVIIIVIVVFLVVSSSSWLHGHHHLEMLVLGKGGKVGVAENKGRKKMHHVGLPLSWVPPSGYSFPLCYPPLSGPTSLRRGEGHQWFWAQWLGANWGSEVVVVVVGGRENEPTSTVDVVDVQFKLYSQVKWSCSILAPRTMIRKIKIVLHY